MLTSLLTVMWCYRYELLHDHVIREESNLGYLLAGCQSGIWYVIYLLTSLLAVVFPSPAECFVSQGFSVQLC